MTRGESRGHLDDLDKEFGSIYDQRVIIRLLPYILQYKLLVVLSFLAMLIYTSTQVALPWIIKVAIDTYIIPANFSGLTWMFGIFIALAVVNWLANYYQQFAMEKVGQGVLFNIRRRMFVHVQKQSVSFFDKTEVGRLMSRVQGDVSQLQEFSAVVIQVLGELLSLTGIIVALLLMNVKLGLITMTVIPMLFLIVFVWQPYIKKSFMEVRRRIAIVNAAFNENITGVRVVQSMNREDPNAAIFDGKNLTTKSSNLKAAKLTSSLLPPVDILTSVAIGLALLFGSRMIASNELEVGALIAFVLYIQRFFDPIRHLTMQYSQIQRAMASGARIFDMLDWEPDIVDAPDAVPMPKIKGEIELKDVSFSYVPGEVVLDKVSLHVNPGEVVAVVGPTGAGKTTLVSLLSRFYDIPPGGGTILVDGYDIKSVTRNTLVGQMSTVLQEPFLFSGTVAENIKYNHDNVTDDNMVAAARAVGAHDFISRLTKGYNTFLAERGMNLSVGQRQLISFARAIVADPRILILDEATANIDSYTEMIIQRALLKVLNGRTAIVIAHRLSTIRGADKIVVLNHGTVEEVGNHTQLIEQKGLYAHLYQMNYASIEMPIDSLANGN
ncbi:ABC transporter ATP-binding protein/permease [Dehalococcoidia bacterium]|nr:ABC transporter ATP-binding protein/permease [Dehalococcoidia bacterium]